MPWAQRIVPLQSSGSWQLDLKPPWESFEKLKLKKKKCWRIIKRSSRCQLVNQLTCCTAGRRNRLAALKKGPRFKLYSLALQASSLIKAERKHTEQALFITGQRDSWQTAVLFLAYQIYSSLCIFSLPIYTQHWSKRLLCCYLWMFGFSPVVNILFPFFPLCFLSFNRLLLRPFTCSWTAENNYIFSLAFSFKHQALFSHQNLKE